MRLEPIDGGRQLVVDDRMLDWIAERIPAMGRGYKWQMASAVGVLARGKIIAGMAIHTFLPHYKSCEITFAADTPLWATKQTIRALLHWPFVQLGCERVMTITDATNHRALRINEGLGFVREGVMRKACRPNDAVVMAMLREETPEWMGLR